jgi:hypothetical protein
MYLILVKTFFWFDTIMALVSTYNQSYDSVVMYLVFAIAMLLILTEFEEPILPWKRKNL